MKKPLPHEVEHIEQFVIEGLIKGYPKSELLELLKAEYLNVKDHYLWVDEEYLDKALRQGIATIRDTTLTDIDKIIPQHIELYEKIYKEFDDLYYVPGKLKAMRQKEKLVGLHKESNFVEVHNELNIETEVEPEYDLNKLNEGEQKRLKELMSRVMNK